MVPVRAARNQKLRAEAQLAAAERAVARTESVEAKEQADDAKAKAAARVAELEAQLAVAEAELQPKLDLFRKSAAACSVKFFPRRDRIEGVEQEQSGDEAAQVVLPGNLLTGPLPDRDRAQAEQRV
jgi:hypothetical protein